MRHLATGLGLAFLLPALFLPRARASSYGIEKDITYCTVGDVALKLNAFVPIGELNPTPAIVEIHGGWWSAGTKSASIERADFVPFTARKIAVFSIDYRLGKDGGFPQCIRDCRNAIRFLRLHADEYNIDPNRIGVYGGSAGGHLAMMLAVVPANFDDGGPPEELKDVKPHISCAFAYCGPTDLLKQWEDSVPGKPGDARPHLRVLFHGVEPDTDTNKELYRRMSPISYVRKGVAALLVCDGENDLIVPGQPGKAFCEKLQAAGADATYYVSPKGGHAYPSGPAFAKVLDAFITRTLMPPAKPKAVPVPPKRPRAPEIDDSHGR
jgi:acetyl esterase/lipase